MTDDADGPSTALPADADRAFGRLAAAGLEPGMRAADSWPT